jgi:hypothetical protein
LGIEEGEVGIAVAEHRRATDQQTTYSLYLYDTATGGAGYVSQIAARLPELLRAARKALDCPRDCDAACQSCLLTHDTQHHRDDLNRHHARNLLSEHFLDALALPVELQAFGAGSQMEMEPLTLVLNREWQRLAVNELRVYLGGPAQDWEPLAWRLRDDLARWVQAEAIIRLIAPTPVLDTLDASQRDELAALTAYTGAELYSAPSLTKAATSTLPLILELGGTDRRVCWAACESSALTPRPSWGGGQHGGPFVRVTEDQALTPLPETWRRLNPQDLRLPTTPGFIALTINRELDGPSATFGERAWSLLERQAPRLAERLQNSSPLQSVQYIDRYLRSPLAFLLLHSLLDALTLYPGGLSPETILDLQTTDLNRFSGESPRFIFHDWQDREDRRQAIETWFRQNWPVFTWREASNRELPHARELVLTWSNEDQWSVRLDQGFGYWRTAPRIRPEFPFDSDVARQVGRLRQVSALVEPLNAAYPTYWYCG